MIPLLQFDSNRYGRMQRIYNSSWFNRNGLTFEYASPIITSDIHLFGVNKWGCEKTFILNGEMSDMVP